MAKYTVVSMPGDGIGNQVLPEALRVLNAVGFETDRYEVTQYPLAIFSLLHALTSTLPPIDGRC